MAQNHERYSRHADLPVYRWIRKHGLSNIQTRVLEQCSSPNELDEAEVRWIAEYGTFEHGLNCSIGGASLRGYKHSEETREKMRGREYTEETRLKMSQKAKEHGLPEALIIAVRGLVGERHHSAVLRDDQIKDIKDALWCGTPVSILAAQYDVKLSVISHINTGITGQHVPWPIGPRREALTRDLQRERSTGRKHTEESKQKMSQRAIESWTEDRKQAWRETFKNPVDDPHVRTKIARAHSSLTEDQVRQVRHLRELGHTYEKIAEEVGSNMSVIYRICKRQAYTWVE